MSNEYSDTQAVRNLEYKNSYQKWVAGLSPKERRGLEEKSLLQPHVDSFKTGKGEDVSELPIAAEIADGTTCAAEEAVAVADQPADEKTLQDESDRIWEVMRRLIGELLCTNNTRLAVECLASVSGVGFVGDSMTEIAARHGVTRAAVSKRCVELAEQLDLMPSRSMKSLTARNAYRNAQNKNHELREQFDTRRFSCPDN